MSRCYTGISMLRVRFAPSPTGFLHIGSARTFIFNWLYARHNGGTMILRIDDTDVERNTEASLNSIFDGLRWLDLGWDEQYRQSERLALHRQVAEAIFDKGLAYRDFTPAQRRRQREIGRARHLAVQCRDARTFARGERPPRRCRRAVRAALPRAARPHRPRPASTTPSTASSPKPRRYRGFRPAAQRRHADLSPGLLRRRCRPAHQPHHPRPGPPHQHLQARADLRSRGRRIAHLRAPAAAHRARWHEALEARPRPCGQRDHLSRRRLSAAGLRQFSVPAGLVAQERSRADVAPGDRSTRSPSKASIAATPS